MPKTNKNFPHNQQAVDLYTCGPSCLQNIYEHYGINKTLSTILQELGVNEKESTHTPQLAKYLKQNDFETIILSSCPDNFSPDWGSKPKDEVIELMKQWVTHNTGDIWLKDTLYLLFYLQDGGELKQVDLSTKIIDQYIDNDYLVLACVDETWIWGKRKISDVAQYDSVKGHVQGHYVVIYGQDGNDYLISDPYPTGLLGKEGLYRVNKDKMLVSILVWEKQTLVLKKA